MGMDMYLFSAHSKKELESDDFWRNADLNTQGTYNTIGEKYYSCKFWDLFSHINAVCFKGEYESGKYVPVTREVVEEMLDYSTHHPDHFDSFNTVESLCELLYHWDEIEENGLQIFFECDW